jgi:hypothetical protein
MAFERTQRVLAALALAARTRSTILLLQLQEQGTGHFQDVDMAST